MRAKEPQNSNIPSISKEQLSAAALVFFFNLMEEWKINDTDARNLLGHIGKSTYYQWKSNPKNHTLRYDVIERISYLTGIYKALRILLPNKKSTVGWIRKPNKAPLFNGQTALDKMLAGRIIDLADIRRFLDAERG